MRAGWSLIICVTCACSLEIGSLIRLMKVRADTGNKRNRYVKYVIDMQNHDEMGSFKIT